MFANLLKKNNFKRRSHIFVASAPYYSGAIIGKPFDRVTLINISVLCDNSVVNSEYNYNSLIIGPITYTSSFKDMFVQGVIEKSGGCILSSIGGKTALVMVTKVTF